jgi:hypothetical protein
VFNVTLNYAVSFLTLVWLIWKLQTILMSAQNALFQQHERFAFGLWKLCLFLILMLSANGLKNVLDYLQWSSLTKMCIVMEQVKNCNFISRLPQGHLGFASRIILTTVCCKINMFWLFDELQTKNYSRLYYRVKIGKENRFQNISGSEHRTNCIICPTAVRNQLVNIILLN